MSARLRIGVDIGGTFTDFTVLGDDGAQRLWKEDSTPDDPVRAITSGLVALAEQSDETVEELLGRTDLLVHGTTIATNMLIQRSGPPIGLLCTEGFRDVLYFRDGYKPERFNIRLPHPEPLVPRYLRIGVPERVGPRGEVQRPLDERRGPRRGRGIPRGRRPRGRRRLPVVDRQRRRTSCARARSSREELPGRRGAPVERRAARDPRVGAHVGDGAERVRAAGDRRLPATVRADAVRGGHWNARR